MRVLRILAVLAMAATFGLAAGCGGGDDDDTAATEATTTEEAAGGEAALPRSAVEAAAFDAARSSE